MATCGVTRCDHAARRVPIIADQTNVGHENPIELAAEPRHGAAIRQTRAKLFINYFQSLVPTLGRRLGSMGSIYHGEMSRLLQLETKVREG